MKTDSFVKLLRNRCQELFRHPEIALPEGGDQRVLQAATQLLNEGIFQRVWLFGDKEGALEKSHLVDGLESVSDRINWVDCETSEVRPALYDSLKQKYAGKLIKDQEIEQWSRSPLYQAGFLLKSNKVDVVLGGAVETPADVIRAAMRTVGLRRGFKFLSGSFLMVRGDTAYVFADSGVIIDPNVFQLADIAKGAKDAWVSILGSEPVIGFLSFSTMGSAKHPSAEKMREAAANFVAQNPESKVVGELQFDAAIDREIGVKKGIPDEIAGKCNVFIFPNLDAGNIAYKLAQRLGGFDAYGPLLQGLALPYGDLSRGASVDDIVTTSYINLLLGHRDGER